MAAHQAPRLWDSPGKNTGVGCHFPLQCRKVKSESEVAQSCPTLRDPMDCSLAGFSTMRFSRQEYWSGVPLPSPKHKTTHARAEEGLFFLVTQKTWQLRLLPHNVVLISEVKSTLVGNFLSSDPLHFIHGLTTPGNNFNHPPKAHFVNFSSLRATRNSFWST